MSGILNWLIEGYKLLQAEGLTVPARVNEAVAAYRQEADLIGAFLCEYTVEQEKVRTPTSELYFHYTGWAKDNGYRPLNAKNFVGELRRRYDVRRDGTRGNVAVGLAIDTEPKPF